MTLPVEAKTIRPPRADVQKAAALHLHYRQRYGVRETSRILGVPRSTVHDWVRHGSTVIKNDRLRLVASVAESAHRNAHPEKAQEQAFAELAKEIVSADLELAERVFPSQPDEDVPTEYVDFARGRIMPAGFRAEFADTPQLLTDAQDYPDKGEKPPKPSPTPRDPLPKPPAQEQWADSTLMAPGQQPLTATTPQIVYDKPPKLLDQLAAEAMHRFVNLLANDVPAYRAVKACQHIDPDFRPGDAAIARTYKALGMNLDPVKLHEPNVPDDWADVSDMVLLANWSAGTVAPPLYVRNLYDEYEMGEVDIADFSLRLRDLAHESYLEGLNAQLSALGQDPVGVITDPQVLYRIDDEVQKAAEGIANTYNSDLGGAVYEAWIEGLATRGRQMSAYHLDNSVMAWSEHRISWKTKQIADTESTRWFNQAVKDFNEHNYSWLPGVKFYVTPDGCKCDGCKALVDGNPYTMDEAQQLQVPLHPNCVHSILPVYNASEQVSHNLWTAQNYVSGAISAAEPPKLDPKLTKLLGPDEARAFDALRFHEATGHWR